MMAWPTIICGALLLAVGVVGYGMATPGDDGKVSPTALIPAVIGGSLLGLGTIAFNPKRRKHAMHLAAVLGLVGFLGGFMPLIRQYNKTGSVDPTKPAAVSGELMILICAVFVGLCVNSFVQARKARRLGQATGQPPVA